MKKFLTGVTAFSVFLGWIFSLIALWLALDDIINYDGLTYSNSIVVSISLFLLGAIAVQVRDANNVKAS